MRLRLVELPVPPSPEGAAERFLEAAAIEPLPDVFVFPELYSTGYVLPRLASLAVGDKEVLSGPVPAFCAARNAWGVAGTLPVMTPAGLVNRLHVYSAEGLLVHVTEKTHLFRQMGEDTVFIPGTPSLVFDTPWMKAGAVVCYDIRFPELSRRLVLAGAEIIFVPAQWPEQRTDLFRCLLRARAAEAQVFVAGCNIGGDHLGVSFQGGGGVASPGGALLHWADVEPGVRDFEIDPHEVALVRRKVDCLRDRRPEVYQ